MGLRTDMCHFYIILTRHRTNFCCELRARDFAIGNGSNIPLADIHTRKMLRFSPVDRQQVFAVPEGNFKLMILA